MKKETGGPAFPSQREHTTKEGMTLRDYFAARSMHGLLANSKISLPTIGAEKMLAEASYQMADAMLKAREQC